MSEITSSEIVRRLFERYPVPQYSSFAELRDTNNIYSKRTIDFFAVGNWQKAIRSVAVEVKISRSDFQRELNDPSKREGWEKEAMECWFAAPADLIDPKEVPDGWGLLVTRGDGLIAKLKAPQRRVEPSTRLMKAMVRRAAEKEHESRHKEAPFAHLLGKKVTFDDLRRLADKLHGTGYTMERLKRQLEELESRRKDGRNDYAENSPLVRAAERLARAYCPDLGWNILGDKKEQAIARMGAAAKVIDASRMADALRKAADEIDQSRGLQIMEAL